MIFFFPNPPCFLRFATFFYLTNHSTREESLSSVATFALSLICKKRSCWKSFVRCVIREKWDANFQVCGRSTTHLLLCCHSFHRIEQTQASYFFWRFKESFTRNYTISKPLSHPQLETIIPPFHLCIQLVLHSLVQTNIGINLVRYKKGKTKSYILYQIWNEEDEYIQIRAFLNPYVQYYNWGHVMYLQFLNPILYTLFCFLISLVFLVVRGGCKGVRGDVRKGRRRRGGWAYYGGSLYSLLMEV